MAMSICGKAIRHGFMSRQPVWPSDIHWNKGVVCHDCHGGDPSGKQFAETHRKEDGFRATAAEIRESCARCHREDHDRSVAEGRAREGRSPE